MPTAKQSFQERLNVRTTDLEQGKTYLFGVAIFRASPDPASTTKFHWEIHFNTSRPIVSFEAPGEEIASNLCFGHQRVYVPCASL